MKKNIVQLIVVSLLFITFQINAQNYNVDTGNSTIAWKGSKPTGTHNGTILLKDGQFVVENNEIIGGTFKIDMNTIVDLDMPADSEYNAKLVKHLKSEDFFGVANHPYATFKISRVEKDGEKTMIFGDLTIKNITNPVSFVAMININESGLEFKSDTFTIDRSKWKIKYKSKSFFENLADKFIYDDMEILVNVKAKK